MYNKYTIGEPRFETENKMARKGSIDKHVDVSHIKSFQWDSVIFFSLTLYLLSHLLALKISSLNSKSHEEISLSFC